MICLSRLAGRCAALRAGLVAASLGTASLGAAGLGLLPMGAMAQPTAYPLSVENCGQTLRFEAAPRNVVTIGQSVTEVLYALGVGDRRRHRVEISHVELDGARASRRERLEGLPGLAGAHRAGDAVTGPQRCGREGLA